MSYVAETLVKDLTQDQPLPIPVVPNWDEDVLQATSFARLIDGHLNREEKRRHFLRGERLMPIGLCPAQRVKLFNHLREELRA